MSSEAIRTRIGRTLLKLVKKGVLSPDLANDLIDDDNVLRYLVILTTDYDGQEDECEWENVGTLGEAKNLVEGHLFKQSAPGYVYYAHVYDLLRQKQLHYDVIQHISWKRGAVDG